MLLPREDSILPREGTSNMYGLNTESAFPSEFYSASKPLPYSRQIYSRSGPTSLKL